jgi:hypothetical protein
MATLTITVPDTSVTRIRNAVAATTGVAAPASLTQVSDLVRQYLRALCIQVEAQQQQTVATTTTTTNVTTDFPPG